MNWIGQIRHWVYENESGEWATREVIPWKVQKIIKSVSQLQQAWNRLAKQQSFEKEKLKQAKASIRYQDEPGLSRLLHPSFGTLHEKHLCSWCMQPEAWTHIMVHTVHLDDPVMLVQMKALISATPDPFVAEIRYYKVCWMKYIKKLYDDDSDGVTIVFISKTWKDSK